MANTKALSRLFYSLSTLLDSGIDIRQALNVAGKKCKNPQLAKAVRRWTIHAGAGGRLSEAMARERHIPPLVVSMVKVGEDTGHMNTVFRELAEFMELKLRLWRRFISNITMPAIQYVAAVFVLSLARYIIGTLQEQPVGLLPPLAAGYGIPVGIIALLWFITKSSGGSRFVHETLWRTPLISHVVRPLALARFSLCFKFALETGMHTKEALRTGFEASGNEAFRARAQTAIAAVSEGKSLTCALEETGIFDEAYISVISVAEESGKVVDRLRWLAQHHSERAENALTMLGAVAAKLIWIMVAGFMVYFIFHMFSTYIIEMRGLYEGI